jgi:alkanesulfonate monooxygenase SsuD/methylene tetrahydromethanopterin reductase-like flavin-dependent oxidoreductase (luciferase family)
MTTIAGEDQVSGRGVTGDGIGMRERPDLPIVRNTVLFSAAQAVHSAMHQLAAAVASITLVRVLDVAGLLGLGPAIDCTPRSARPSAHERRAEEYTMNQTPTAPATVRSGLFVPLFDELANPVVVARLAAEAEEAGWDGFFVWDHVRWRPPVVDVADPWITLAATATATERIRLGPMVTPLARRRPVKVAKETATLDRLSGGRLTLGVGLGSDRFGNEFSITGEELDDRRRAGMLDESLEILAAAWSGDTVHYRGEHYTVGGMRFLPRPVQRPGVPIWVAGYYGSARPLRRAAGYQGFFPANLQHPDQLAEIVAAITTLREQAGTDTEPYDIVAGIEPGHDPTPYGAAGATWWLVGFPPDAVTIDLLRGVIRDSGFVHEVTDQGDADG